MRRADNRTDNATLNELSKRILGAAFHIHTALGPGLLESAYEACLEHELRRRGLAVERQKQLPVRYDDIKAVRQFAPIHEAQVLTYLKLAGVHLGLLLNFNVIRLRDGGIKRLVHEFPDR